MLEKTSIDYCKEKIIHFETKANHNKREALWCFRIVMIATLLVPLFVTLGENAITTKVIPAVISSIAAFCTAWIQQRKPQGLWSLYRTTQRRLEEQLLKHNHLLGEYECSANPDKLLMMSVSDIVGQTHEKWLPMVPSVHNLNSTE